MTRVIEGMSDDTPRIRWRACATRASSDPADPDRAIRHASVEWGEVSLRSVREA